MPKLRSPFGVPFARSDAERLAAALTALADASRLQILGILWHNGESTQAEIRKAQGRLSQPTVSHHMCLLHAAGLVSTRKDGQYMRSRLTSSGVIAVAVALNPEAHR